MTPEVPAHLSADELDSLHTARPSGRATSHIVTCHDCRRLVEFDARLIAALGALPTWEPATDFATGVLARLSLAPAAARSTTSPAAVDPSRAIAARRRVVLGGAVLGGIVATGFAWALLDPTAAQGLAGPAAQNVADTMWFSLKALAANTIEQPWFGVVRDTILAPTSTLPVIAIGALGYVAVLFGFGRLLTASASDASW